MLDRFEEEQPETRVVRLRPSLIFKRGSADEQRRYFLGPALLARKEAIAVVPDIGGMRFQAVHSDDVAEAYNGPLGAGHGYAAGTRGASAGIRSGARSSRSGPC